MHSFLSTPTECCIEFSFMSMNIACNPFIYSSLGGGGNQQKSTSQSLNTFSDNYNNRQKSGYEIQENSTIKFEFLKKYAFGKRFHK